MATHYEVLGVTRGASDADVRRAYHDRARALHPDRNRSGDSTGSERAMQDVNEAWRVLRDPGLRAAYDLHLAGGSGAASATRPPGGASFDPDDLDRVYHGRPAEPGDVGLSLVRAAPWAAVLFVMLAIFVFTAFAGSAGEGDGDEPPGPFDLVGRCIRVERAAGLMAVPCVGPNEGRVDLVANRASSCPMGTLARPYDGDGPWLCLRDASEP